MFEFYVSSTLSDWMLVRVSYRIVIFSDPVERVANDAFKQWELQPSAEWMDKRKGNDDGTRMSAGVLSISFPYHSMGAIQCMTFKINIRTCNITMERKRVDFTHRHHYVAVGMCIYMCVCEL